jgi:hypothetical protein
MSNFKRASVLVIADGSTFSFGGGAYNFTDTFALTDTGNFKITDWNCTTDQLDGRYNNRTFFNGEFITPYKGYYEVSCTMQLGEYDPTNIMVLEVWVNGVRYDRIINWRNFSDDLTLFVPKPNQRVYGTCILFLNKKDKLSFHGLVGGDYALNGTEFTKFTIKRINPL